MLFSKAIQIKLLVNELNQFRKRADFSYIEFKAEMYRDGKWAVTLTAMGNGLFYSFEMGQLVTLFVEDYLNFSVAAYKDTPYIYIQ